MSESKTIAELFGLKEGVSVSLTHISGSQNGQTFDGLLTCDVEVGQPVFMDNGMDVTDNVVSVEVQEKGKLFVETTKGECIIEFK